MAEKHPSEQLMDLRGSMYLPVNQRLAWLVLDQREGKIGSYRIVTTEIEHRLFEDPKRKKENAESRVKAEVTIYDASGNEIAYASSIGTETMLDFRDYSEKAETKAVGRALAMVGYGTQHSAQDFEEGEKESPIDGKVGPAVADAPVKKTAAKKAPAKKTPPKPQSGTENVTVDEKAQAERKKEIAAWIQAEKAKENDVPFKLVRKAAQDYKTSSGLDSSTSLGILDLPLETLEKVVTTAEGLSTSA